MEIKKEILNTHKNIEIFKPFKEGHYKMPTEVIFGRGLLEEIGKLLLIKEIRKIALVAGNHFKNSEIFNRLSLVLAKSVKEVHVYPQKIIKSDIKTVNNLTYFCRYEDFEIIIAIGGGTILDTAKCAAALLENEGLIEDYVVQKNRVLKNKSLDLIALPTTAGTGSEVSPWATVWDTTQKKKYSLSSPLMFPKLAIIDPQLTDSLPSVITAETGLDALAQAIESYWSVNHNPISDKFALASVKLCMKNLEKVVNRPDKSSRDQMAKASMLTGLAFSNTQTTICHAVSYPMTAHFSISHGQAVAITLPEFLKETIPVLQKERKESLLHALGAENENKARMRMIALMKKIGLATKLSQLGIKKEDIRLIVSEGFHPDRVKNAPKILTPEELQKMLEEIL